MSVCYVLNKIPGRDVRDRVRKWLVHAKGSYMDFGMG